jgi:hypothetical protein
MTPPFGLTDVQLFEERAGRPELIRTVLWNSSACWRRLLA